MVRLRDWLGPEEELVPIGPRADQAPAAPDEPARETESGSGFWEGDASLQTALPAPMVHREPNRASGAGWGLARRWRWLIAGLAIAALAAGTLVIVSGGTGRAPSRSRVEEAGVGKPLLPNLTKTIDRAAASTRAIAAAQERRMLKARAERRRRAAARRKRLREARVRARRERAAAAARAAAASQPVQTVTTTIYTQTAASSPSPSETEPAQTTPIQTPTPTPSPPSDGGGSSGGGASGGGGSNSSSSNTYGPAGSLGPGSSPDS